MYMIFTYKLGLFLIMKVVLGSSIKCIDSYDRWYCGVYFLEGLDCANF